MNNNNSHFKKTTTSTVDTSVLSYGKGKKRFGWTGTLEEFKQLYVKCKQA